MQTTKPVDPVKRLSKNVKRIKFKNHYETWHSEKTDPKANLNIPGRHVDENGVIRDKNNLVVIAVTRDLIAKGTKINTSLGMGKRYDTLPKQTNTVSIFTNW